MERCVFKWDAALRFPHRTKCLRGSWRGSAAIPDTQPTSRFGGDGVSVGCETRGGACPRETGESRGTGEGSREAAWGRRSELGPAGGLAGDRRAASAPQTQTRRLASAWGAGRALRGGGITVIVKDAFGPGILRNARFSFFMHLIFAPALQSPLKKLFRNIESHVLSLY